MLEDLGGGLRVTDPVPDEVGLRNVATVLGLRCRNRRSQDMNPNKEDSDEVRDQLVRTPARYAD